MNKGIELLDLGARERQKSHPIDRGTEYDADAKSGQVCDRQERQQEKFKQQCYQDHADAGTGGRGDGEIKLAVAKMNDAMGDGLNKGKGDNEKQGDSGGSAFEFPHLRANVDDSPQR